MSGPPPPICDYAWWLILNCIGHVVARCRFLAAQRAHDRADLERVIERAETLRLMIFQAVLAGQVDLIPVSFKQDVYDAQERIKGNIGSSLSIDDSYDIEDKLIQIIIKKAESGYPSSGFKDSE